MGSKIRRAAFGGGELSPRPTNRAAIIPHHPVQHRSLQAQTSTRLHRKVVLGREASHSTAEQASHYETTDKGDARAS